MATKSSITTQYFDYKVIPVIQGVIPKEPFRLRKNVTAQIATPMADDGSLTLKVKGIEFEATLFESEFQTLIWGIGSELMFQLGTLGSMFFGRSSRVNVRDPEDPGVWVQHAVDIGAGIIASKSIITQDTEITYVITPRITTDEDWGLTVSETIPGRVPQETTTHEFKTESHISPWLASEAFPMTFYIGWIPVELSGILGLPIFSKVSTPGTDRGLIYTEVAVA